MLFQEKLVLHVYHKLTEHMGLSLNKAIIHSANNLY